MQLVKERSLMRVEEDMVLYSAEMTKLHNMTTVKLQKSCITKLLETLLIL